MPIADTTIASHLARDCPHLARLIAALFNLPLLLETALGLSLRVPQVTMGLDGPGFVRCRSKASMARGSALMASDDEP